MPLIALGLNEKARATYLRNNLDKRSVGIDLQQRVHEDMRSAFAASISARVSRHC